MLQYNDDGKIIAEFESVKDASKETGIGYYSIYDVILGKQKHAGGYGFIYKKDYSGNKSDLISRSTNRRPAMVPVPVLQCDNNGNVINKFESISQAERETSVSSICIYKALKGKQKHAGGYLWKYKE